MTHPNASVSKVREIGPYSSPNTLVKIDKRTKEAALLRETRAALVAHVGGKPSPVQAQLIERAAMLTLHVAMFDAKALESGGLAERDGRQYLSYSNSLARTLRQLGLKSAAQRGPSLEEVIAAGRAGATA